MLRQIVSNAKKYSPTRTNPRCRAFLVFSFTSVQSPVCPLVFLLVLALCGSFGEKGNGIKVGLEQLPASIFFRLSSLNRSIYYETSETTRVKDHEIVEQLLPKTTQEANVEEVHEEAFFDLPPAMTDDDAPSNKTEVTVHRFIRQILSLPKTTPKPGVVRSDIERELTPEIKNLIKIYQEFLTDYVNKKGWRSAILLVPQQVSLELCEYFGLPVLRAAMSLTKLECNDDSMVSDIIKDRHEPVILADFLAKTRINNERTPIDARFIVKNFKILLLARNESVEDVVNSAQPELLVNYKWVLARHTGGDVVELYKVFGFATSFNPLFQQTGNWTMLGRLKIDAAKDTGLQNFQGQMLRVTTVNGPPVVNLGGPKKQVEGEDLVSLSATGYLPDLLELLSVVLNFTYVIITPSDGKFGDSDSQGNWSGMVGQIQRNEADIALMSFSLTKSRLSVMEFSPPVEYSSTRLLIRRDWQSAELKLDAFIRPFEWKVWATILLLIGLGTITLIIFASFRLFKATAGESMWLLSTCFLLQGQNEHSTIRVTPFRIVGGTFWMLAVFIFACYTARLTSFLAADSDKLPVKDLEEAVRSRSWKVGLVKGSSFLEKVKESKSTEMGLLWKRLQDDSSVLVNGFPDGIAKVYKERYIFFTSELIPTYMVKENCSYAWLPGKYFPGFGYMGYQKGLPYASTISHKLSKVRETGLMRRTFKKWWGTTSACSIRAGTNGFTAISLLETGSAFLILIVGASIAVSLGVFEFMLAVKRERELERSFSANEFAAPVVQGAASILPLMLHSDKPFIWRVQETNSNLPRVLTSDRFFGYDAKSTIDHYRNRRQ